MDNKKKPTNAQLQKRIANSIVHVDKTKDTQTIFFDDKGLRLAATEDYAVIETGYHRHVFNNFTSSGVCRPWLYTKRMIEIATENDCFVDGGHSYQRLMQVLKDKKDQSEYNIATYYDWWLMNIYAPLFAIGETEAECFLVYVDYMHNLARNSIFLEEHKDGLTNKQFIEKWLGLIRDFTKGMDEHEIFVPKTDEQIMQENIDAIQQDENEKVMQEQIQNETQKEND